MSAIAHYSLINFRPHVDRNEVITIGLLIRFDDEWDVRLLSDEAKVVALNPLYPQGGLTAVAVTLNTVLENIRTFSEAYDFLETLGGSPGLQKFVGQFPAATEPQYETEVAWLLSELVAPPVKPSNPRARIFAEPRLRTKLRNHFKNQQILAKNKDQINDHKVVERFPISEGKGLFAEFALKNSCMHITETVDFDVGLSSNRSKRLEAQAKTLILSAAKTHLGDTTRTYVIVAGSNRNVAKTSINLLEDYADVFALESAQDMDAYFKKIYTAANPSQSPLATQ